MRLKLPIAHLLKAQRRWEKALVKATATSRKLIIQPRNTRPKKDKLTEVSSFGTNPGNLRMLTYVPPQDNVYMIYAELGVYNERLGTPCDDL